MKTAPRFRRIAKKLLVNLYRTGLRFGVHIVPEHYYTPLADIRALARRRSEWARKSELLGIEIDLQDQLANLERICLPYLPEYESAETYRRGMTAGFGPGFGRVEAQALHGVIRCFKPQRIVEVGGGVSTFCTLAALQLNRSKGGQETELTCIEPFPSEALKSHPSIQLIAQPVQRVGFEVFTRLGPRDLLFIDSSHTVKVGGDVNYLILEVLPRLGAGVLVQVHDISFPFDYQRDILHTCFQRSETALLRAFLTFNQRVETLFCLSHLHHERPDDLQRLFPGYRPLPEVDGLLPDDWEPEEARRWHSPSSIYLVMK